MIEKTTKAEPAPKKDPAPKKEAAATKEKSASPASSDAAPANYSRGEGQKTVTQAYRDNWNAIFAKPKARKARAGARRATSASSRSKRTGGR